MSSYFKYDILSVMNITDVEYKIIYSARKAHLFKDYKENEKTVEEVVIDVEKALEVGLSMRVDGVVCEGRWCSV